MHAIFEFTYTYLYFTGTVIFFLIWLMVFLKNGINKKEMLGIGMLFGIAAVLINNQYALHDYWHPLFLIRQIPLEDFLYGFFFGGISTQAYFFFFKTKERITANHHPVFVVVVVLASILCFVILTGLLKINSIVAHIIPPLIVGLYIGIKNPNYLKVQIINGFLTMIATLIMFKILLIINPRAIIDNWYLNNLTGVLIVGIPLEEYVFAFVLGFGASVFYEYVTGREIVTR